MRVTGRTASAETQPRYIRLLGIDKEDVVSSEERWKSVLGTPGCNATI